MNNNKEFQWTDELVKEYAKMCGCMNLENFKKSKEVKPDYEILSIASKEGGVWSCDKRTFDWDIKNKGFVIHQVMRLSDHEVFTLGDEIKWDWAVSHVNSLKIKSFFLNKAQELCMDFTNENAAYQNLRCLGNMNLKKVKPDYEILSFEDTALNVYKLKEEGYQCGKACDCFTLTQMLTGLFSLEDGSLKIKSVKKLSNGEVFTIGDMGMISCIESFVINDNQMYVKEVLGAWSPLNILKKIKPILFTTEDGVDIFHCDYYYLLNTLNWTYTKNNTINTYYPNEYPFLNFSSEGIAKEYIIKNKPISITLTEITDELRFDFPPDYILNSLEKFFKNKIKL